MKFCEKCKSIIKNEACTNKKCSDYKEVKEEKEKIDKDFKRCPTCKEVFLRLDLYFHRDGHGNFDYCWDCNSSYRRDYNKSRNLGKGKYQGNIINRA